MDPVMLEIASYWSPRARIIRALQRFDGAADPREIFEACGVGAEDARAGNTYTKALARLVARGIAVRLVAPKTGLGHGSTSYSYKIAPRYRRAKRVTFAERRRPMRVA